MRIHRIIPSLDRTRFFFPLRESYLRICKRKYWKEHVLGLRRFYSQFVKPGSIVFDIGANDGEFTWSFLSLGATKVIAVEPNPQLAQRLKSIRDKRLTVVEAAVDGHMGTASFHVSNHNVLSSLSEEWIEKVAGEVDGAQPAWVETVTVQTVTLDSLIEKYGRPDFIKLDIEGREFEALEGLTRASTYLSFEFHSGTIETTLRCLKLPCFQANARFNYVLGESSENTLVSKQWVDAQEMGEILKMKVSSGKLYGDVLVRS